MRIPWRAQIGGAVVLSDDGVTPCLGTHDAQGNPIPEHLVGCKFDDDGWLIPPWEVLPPNFDQVRKLEGCQR